MWQTFRWVLTIEAAVIVVALVAWFGHSFVVRLRERSDGTQVERAMQLLLRAIARGTQAPPSERDITELLQLPDRVLMRSFLRIAPQTSGSGAAAITELADRAGVTAQAARWCTSRRWWRRLHGARVFTAIGGGGQHVSRLLQDRNADVRAQAAEWATAHPTHDVIVRLISLMGDAESLPRFAAQDSLLRMGTPVVEPLAQALEAADDADPSFLLLALKVARGLANLRFLEVALELSRHEDPDVRSGAAALLGAIGGDEAAGRLLELTGDPGAQVRAGAVAALGALGHWPASTVLVRLMRDLSWDVRRAAALALRSLGAPGELQLRRLLSDGDRFAADIARQTLDLPIMPSRGW